MNIGYIGLGKMGLNMVTRLIDKGHNVVAFDKNNDAINSSVEIGAIGSHSLQDLTSHLPSPKTIWIMVPNKYIGEVISELKDMLTSGDTVIDGGNTYFKDTIKHAKDLHARGIRFIDCGVSGGPEGARNGACLMIGGEVSIYEEYEELFRDLAVSGGFGYMGRSGAGHFVKMVHNGIEYGMMQAIAEGFTIMRQSEFDLDMKKIANVYNHGSVITSRLIGWLQEAFEKYGEDLSNITGKVAHTGEGEWAIEVAKELGIETPIIENALKFRRENIDSRNYTGQILSALRNAFGGHEAKSK